MLFNPISKLLIASAAALVSLIPSASARPTSLTAPTTPLKIGEYFNATFHTSGFIQNNLQYYAIFGIVPQAQADNSGLFTLLGTGYDFVTNGVSSTGPGSFNVTLQIPESAVSGEQYVLTSAVLGTVGASEQVTLTTWKANITIA